MINNIAIIPIFFVIYFLLKKKINLSLFYDTEYNKPQAFHSSPTPRIGGVLISLSLVFPFFNYFLYNDLLLMISIFILINTIIGFVDDIKIISNPILRFFIFIFSNLVLIIVYDLKINNFDIFFLDYINQYSDFCSYFLILSCLFFCVNGSNLIDGFNGLLLIHSIIILTFYFFIVNDNNLKNIITILIILFSCCLTINFPKAKIFLGDTGSYLIGSSLALITIITSNSINYLNSFFFAIILYYIFFEIFFSVFRKIYERKNPFKPDNLHLHMLVYKYLKIKKKINYPNYLTSLIINLFYLFSLVPIFLIKNEFLLKVYFFTLLLNYLIIYLLLRKKIYG